MSKQPWQRIVEQLMEAKQKPILKNSFFEQLTQELLNTTGIFEDHIKLRAFPSTSLFRIAILPYARLHGTADLFWAGEQKADFMKKEGPIVYIDQKNTIDSIVSAGRMLAEEQINTTMEQVTDELAFFCKQLQETKKVPFAMVQSKYRNLAAKTHFDIQENPDGANLVLSDDQVLELSFEDILEWLIYVSPMLGGQGQLWLKTMNCESCGKFFFYERSTAKFCSDACRMQAAYKSRRSK